MASGMAQLMDISEIRERWNNREDPFDLTIEKWARIRRFIDTASTVRDFNELLQAANVAVPFCFQYQVRSCAGCPLEKICARGRARKFLKVVRLLQLHVFAILSGDPLLKGPLVSEVDGLVRELEAIKAKSNGLNH